MMMFNWRLWMNGLVAAVISGAVTGAIDAITNSDLKGATNTATAGALVGGLMYLKTHPPINSQSTNATQ